MVMMALGEQATQNELLQASLASKVPASNPNHTRLTNATPQYSSALGGAQTPWRSLPLKIQIMPPFICHAA